MHDFTDLVRWVASTNSLQEQLYLGAKAKGFWESTNFGEKIALIHSELSEALEKHRKTIGKGLPDEADEHCPDFGGIAIEFADVAIRLMDLCEYMDIDLASAILAKSQFNATRPPKHGKAY